MIPSPSTRAKAEPAFEGWRGWSEMPLLRCRRPYGSSRHASIMSVTCEKLLVSAVLNYGAGGHHIDLVTTFDGFEPVRDEHDGTLALQPVKGLN